MPDIFDQLGGTNTRDIFDTLETSIGAGDFDFSHIDPDKVLIDPREANGDEFVSRAQLEKDKAGLGAITKGLTAGSLTVASGVAGAAKRFFEPTTNVQSPYQVPSAYSPPGGEAAVAREKLSDMSKTYHQAAQLPRLQMADNASFPERALNIISQVVPYAAGASLATAVGGPAGALAFTSAVEGNSIYLDALEDMKNRTDLTGPQKEKIARVEGDVGGAINGLLELAQFNKMLKFTKGKAPGNLAKLVRKAVSKRIAGHAGRELTVDLVAGATENAFEEVLQELTSMGAAKLGHDKTFQPGEVLTRIKESAEAGAIGYLGLGGAGRAGHSIIGGTKSGAGSTETVSDPQIAPEAEIVAPAKAEQPLPAAVTETVPDPQIAPDEVQAAERLADEWSISGQEALKHVRKMREAPDPEAKQKPVTPVIVAGKSTTAEDAMAEATAVAGALPQRATTGPARSLGKDIKGIVGGTWESTRRTLAKTLDSGNEDGPFTRLLHTNPEDGRAKADEYITNLERLENNFREEQGITEERLAKMGRATNPRLPIVEKFFPTITQVPVDIRGKTWDLTEGQMLSIYLSDMQIKTNNKGDTIPIGHNHMTKHGIRLAHDGEGTGPIPEATLEQIKAHVDADPATKAIIDQYLAVEAPTQSSAINDTARKMGEPDIATLPDWYALHVSNDAKLAGRTFLDASPKQSSIKEVPGEFRIDPLENQSIFKHRVGDAGDLVIHDFFEQRHHQRHAIGGYVGLAPSFRLARTVLNDPKIRRLIKSRGYGNIDELLRHSFARQQGSERMPMAQPKWMRKLMQNFYRAIGRFPHVIMIQATSVPTNMTVMDMPYAVQSLRGLVDYKTVKTEMLNRSPIMYQRYYGGFASMEAAEASGAGVVLRAMTGRGSHAELGSSLVRGADLRDLATTWEGVKAEFTALKDGTMPQTPNALSWKWWKDHDATDIEVGSTEYWRLIARRHQDAVQRSKPSWDAGNRTFLTSDTNALKRSVLGLFRSFAGKMHESVIDARNDYNISDKSAEAKSVCTQRLAAVWLSFTMGYVLKELLRAGIKRESREPWEYAVGAVTSPLSILPGVGTMIREGTRRLVKATGGYRGSTKSFDTFDSPYLEAPNQMAQGAGSFAEASGHYLSGNTMKGDRAFKNAFKQTAETVGMFYFGIPTPIIKDALKGWAPSGRPNNVTTTTTHRNQNRRQPSGRRPN